MLRSLLIIGVVCCILSSACKKESTTVEPPPEDTSKIDTPKVDTPQYKLIWSEEFEYSGLPDPAKWGYEIGFIRNEEDQYYEQAKLENSKVENGMLFITSTYDSTRTHAITSASIMTKDKMEFIYGKLEARIKMPAGKGAWPAFWTVGVNRETIGWPACGEIDIMEWLGSAPQYIFGSLHKGNASNKDNPLIRPYIVDSANVNGLSEDFHTYGIEWDSTQIRFYVDTTSYVTYKDTDMDASEWVQFTKPHYLLLNLAMGGKSGGVIDSTRFPFTYTVDYVRYYRKEK